MGGSTGSGDSQQSLGTQNVMVPFLQNLFGQKTHTDPWGGGFRPGGVAGLPGIEGYQFANPMFGPDSFSGLSGLTDTTDFGEQGLDMGGLIERTAGQQQELSETGFKTDISPAVDLSRRLFEEEFIPGALEQFGSLGLDARDSDTQGALLREGSRRATELGALDIDLSEAAAGRRMAGMQAAPGLMDLQNLGVASEFGGSEAGQLLNRLLTIGGMNTQAGVTGEQQDQTSKGWGLFS